MPGARPGVATRFGTVPGANHFTAIAPLADPDSPMVSRLKELAANARFTKAWDGPDLGPCAKLF